MTLESGFTPPVRTKLRPPRLAHDVIDRPRLLTRLNRMATLSLVVAPAGYGKTTLLTTWLAQAAAPSAWLSLDESDNDPAVFLTDVIAALRTRFPEFGGDLLQQLNSLSGQLRPSLAGQLLNELDTLVDEFILVLDDYHTIHSLAIHQLLTQLLMHPPRPLHLVIAARHDPPIPWHLRTRGNPCEIRSRELSFTQVETAEFLAKASELPIEEELSKALAERSEGWVASLRLAALSMRRQSDPSTWPSLLSGNRRDFGDYFAAEVVAYLPEDTRDFLVRTSILDVLHGELCDYVLGSAAAMGRGTAQLQQLVAEGVFIVALDNDGAWYRLHPLFRSALRHQLQEAASGAEIAELYGRAAAWYEGKDLFEDALRYALDGGLVTTAVAVVQRHRHQLMNEADFLHLDRWLRRFPLAVIEDHVELLLVRAWLFHVRFEFAGVRLCLEQIATLRTTLSAEDYVERHWTGETAVLAGALHVCAGRSAQAVTACLQALELLPRNWYHVRSAAMLYATFGFYMQGDVGKTEALLQDVAADATLPRSLAALYVQQIRHFVQLLAADLDTMEAEFPALLQMASLLERKTTVAWAHYFEGCAAYLQDYLGNAAGHFHAVLELRDYANAGAYTHSAIGLALILQAQGKPEHAAAVVADCQEYLREIESREMLEVIDAFAAELAARQCRVETALHWLATDGRGLTVDATPLFYIPGLAPVRVLLAAGKDEDLSSAQAWLDRVAAIAEGTHNVHAQIQVLTLRAAVHAARGDRPQALATLDRAVTLAEQGGVVRVFVDLRDGLEPLLEALQPGTQPAADFLVRIRSAVASARDAAAGLTPAADLESSREDSPMITLVDGQSNSELHSGGEQPDLRVLLTYREMDVLRLLAQRLTNKEIAHELGISTETVRQHVVKLFRKLHVENRRQAIVVARKMGYFDGG